MRSREIRGAAVGSALPSPRNKDQMGMSTDVKQRIQTAVRLTSQEACNSHSCYEANEDIENGESIFHNWDKYGA